MIFIFWFTRRFLAELNESCALQIHVNEDTQARFRLETVLLILVLKRKKSSYHKRQAGCQQLVLDITTSCQFSHAILQSIVCLLEEERFCPLWRWSTIELMLVTSLHWWINVDDILLHVGDMIIGHQHTYMPEYDVGDQYVIFEK